MNYIGSKYSLLDFLYDSIYQITGGNFNSLCDAFAGTGSVGAYFKQKGYKVISNDIQYYSYVLLKHYIWNNKQPLFSKLLSSIKLTHKAQTLIQDKTDIVFQYLNELDGNEGFIYKNYCLGGTKGTEFERMYFTDINGKKTDAIRQKIENWYSNKLINENEYFFLLASLIESIDKYANTASVYGAFLKKFKTSAKKDLILKPVDILTSLTKHIVYNEDVNALIGKIHCDVLYLDPPYNQRQYATNYHLLETIARYDSPTIYGKTGLRNYTDQKSKYSSSKEVLNSFTNLIENSNTKFIFLSYNNEGLMNEKDILSVLARKGKNYGIFKKNYKRFKADKTENRNHKAEKTVEYLYYVVVD